MSIYRGCPRQITEIADRLSFFLELFAKGYVEFRRRSGVWLNLLIGRIDTPRLKASAILVTLVNIEGLVKIGFSEDETRDVKILGLSPSTAL